MTLSTGLVVLNKKIINKSYDRILMLMKEGSSSSSLPYEIVKKEGQEQENTGGKKYAAMKRVEAFIAAEKTDKVVSALEALNLQATFYESKGMGKGEKYRLSYGRGAGTTKMSYSERHTVVTIVEENRVGAVVAAIRREAAKTDKTSAGIIVISAVEDILSI
jgi:nitrogen regulatory protein PII